MEGQIAPLVPMERLIRASPADLHRDGGIDPVVVTIGTNERIDRIGKGFVRVRRSEFIVGHPLGARRHGNGREQDRVGQFKRAFAAEEMITEFSTSREKSSHGSLLVAEWIAATRLLAIELRFHFGSEQVHDRGLMEILDNDHAILSDLLDDVGRFVSGTEPSDVLGHAESSLLLSVVTEQPIKIWHPEHPSVSPLGAMDEGLPTPTDPAASRGR